MHVLVIALVVPHFFEASVGDDFVGAHVRRGPCATLQDTENEFFVECAGVNLFTDLDNHVGFGGVENTDLFVCESSCVLDTG